MAIHHIYIYTYISTYKHTQAITTHPKATRQPNHTLSRPAPRSGGRASLRRESLAQTSPPPPRRGLETRNRNHYGISLRRDPSHLGEWFARSKMMSRSPGRLFEKEVWASLCQTRLGEPELAWARLTVLALIRLQHMCFSKPTNHAKNSTHQNSDLSIQTTNKLKNSSQPI